MGPAREGDLGASGWVRPHAHHLRQRNPRRLRRQGHWGSRQSCDSDPDRPRASLSSAFLPTNRNIQDALESADDARYESQQALHSTAAMPIPTKNGCASKRSIAAAFNFIHRGSRRSKEQNREKPKKHETARLLFAPSHRQYCRQPRPR